MLLKYGAQVDLPVRCREVVVNLKLWDEARIVALIYVGMTTIPGQQVGETDNYKPYPFL